mgnify:CR=1 FL=1
MSLIRWEPFRTGLSRWDPFRELEDMSERLNRAFGRTPVRREGGQEAITVADWEPSVDIAETPEYYLVKAELPEVRKEDVKVTVQDGVLTLTGERKSEREEKGKKYHRVERCYGSFLRRFTLPDDVDEAKLHADFKDGMLNITLPRSEKAKAKSVEVKVA